MMSTQDNLEVSLRFVAKQRTLEIAKRGYSEITLPKNNKKRRRASNKRRSSLSLFDNNNDKHHVTAMLLIAKTLKKEEATRHSIEFKIRHDSKMAEERLRRGNEDGASLAMAKVVTVQYEYVHILRRIAAIKALRNNVDSGFTECKQVEENLDEILSIRGAPQTPRDFDCDELLDELEDGNFFPILNAEDGSISFTDCYDHASSSMDDDDEEDDDLRYTRSPKSVLAFY